MSDELSDRVARDDATYMAMKRKIMSLIVDTWDGKRLIDNAADAAIALCLEEAAKVADDEMIYTAAGYHRCKTNDEIAAAIRALGKPPTG